MKRESAFPIVVEYEGDYDKCSDVERGMSLRDYFAIHATDKDIDDYREWYRETGSPFMSFKKTIIEARYAFADAMLKERDK